MKYSLRSLMIGITLFCALLGGLMARIEYLRRMEAFHHDEVLRYAVKDAKSFEDAVAYQAAFEQHMELSNRYRYATRHPWTIVDTEPPKIDRQQFEKMKVFWDKTSNSSAPAPNPSKP